MVSNKNFLLYNDVPCISRFNLQRYHILIILSASANSMITQLQTLWILY